MSGFSLLELMVVVVIIGIISAYGYSVYTENVIQTRRSDAKDALGRLATLQEKIFTECNRYATQLTDLATRSSCNGGPPDGLGRPTPELAWDVAANMVTPTTGRSADGHYVISIQVPTPGPNAATPCTTNICFLLEADPSLPGATGLQQRNGAWDGRLRHDHAGRKSWDRGNTGVASAVTGMFNNTWTD
jgi:type IV pilus assembly protein PilE